LVQCFQPSTLDCFLCHGPEYVSLSWHVEGGPKNLHLNHS
jgi:hypothetical protein